MSDQPQNTVPVVKIRLEGHGCEVAVEANELFDHVLDRALAAHQELRNETRRTRVGFTGSPERP